MKTICRTIILCLICILCVSDGLAQEDPAVSLRKQIAAAATPQDRIRLQLKLADQLNATGHKEEAIQQLQLVANSGVFDPIAFYNLGNAFARLGESEAAVAAYRKAIEQRKGQYSRAYNNLGVVLLRLGRWDEAYDALIAALNLEGFRYAEASYNLGRVYQARGQSDLAAREWHRALAVDPHHEAAAQALARSSTEERIVLVEARPASRTAPPNSGISKPAPSRAAASKPAPPTPAESESKSVAIRSSKTLALDPVSYDMLQRARTAAERGKMPEAVENYRRLLDRENGYFAPANLELSYALLSLKRLDEAFGNLLQVSKRDGARYPASYYHLARIYELRGELQLAEAAFLQASTGYNPPNVYFLLDLMRVREKQGNFKGALEALEHYVALMDQQGKRPVWSDQQLSELRAKIK
jgi:tetratricopeptide (TPR) repeat protein